MAEVLIVLGVLGLIADMTIPTLIGNYNKQVTISRLKQNYSLLSQALNMAQAEYGDPKNWDNLTHTADDYTETMVKFVETYIVPYMKGYKTGKFISLEQAGYSVYYNVYGKTNSNLARPRTLVYIIELANGSTIFFSQQSTLNMTVYIDINGKKKPNIWGRDAFMFEIINTTGRLNPIWFRRSREEHITTTCKQGQGCASLIMLDGWQIKDDYPISF